MVLVIIFTFSEIKAFTPENGAPLIAGLTFTLFLKGLRGILLHQIADRKNDRKARFCTLATRLGPLALMNLVNRVLLPIEIVSISMLGIMVNKLVPGIFTLFVLFLSFKSLKFRFWNIRDIAKRKFKYYRFVFTYILNDYYEEWIPAYILILLSIRDVRFLLILIPFTIIFPNLLIKTFREANEAFENLGYDLKNMVCSSQNKL
jgi:hypothetical protein